MRCAWSRCNRSCLDRLSASGYRCSYRPSANGCTCFDRLSTNGRTSGAKRCTKCLVRESFHERETPVRESPALGKSWLGQSLRERETTEERQCLDSITASQCSLENRHDAIRQARNCHATRSPRVPRSAARAPPITPTRSAPGRRSSSAAAGAVSQRTRMPQPGSGPSTAEFRAVEGGDALRTNVVRVRQRRPHDTTTKAESLVLSVWPPQRAPRNTACMETSLRLGVTGTPKPHSRTNS